MKIKKGVTILLAVTGILLAIVITLLPLVGLNKDKLIPLFDDDFAVANLQAQVSWSYAECAFGLLYLAGVIVALVWMRRSFRRGMLVLVAVQVLIIQVTVAHFTPKIEAFSQRAAIEYYQSLPARMYTCGPWVL